MIIKNFSIAITSMLLLWSLSLASQNTGTPYQSSASQKDLTEEWSEARLVWQDEFDGSHIDTSKWLYQTGDGGWGNNEWQNYTAGDNAEVENGILKIIAKKVGTGQQRGDYTSTRLNSTMHWQYGHFAIRAKIPTLKGKGIWPAIWMMGSNIGAAGWPQCGELDIMEYVSYDPDHVHQTFHSTANNHTNGTQVTTGALLLESIEEEFHIYGLVWDSESISFYIDDLSNVLLHFDKPENADEASWPFDQKFYVLMNMAVGGNWGGKHGVDDAIFPSTFEIDYVRVYQK